MKFIIFWILFLVLGCANSDDSYPREIDELVYFSVGNSWGDPEKKDKFRIIRVEDIKITTESNIYSNIEDLLTSKEFEGVIGIAIDFKSYWSDDKEEELVNSIIQKGIERVVKFRSRKWIAARQIYLDRTTGKISGTIRSSETGKPIPGVYVSAEYFGDSTDEKGNFTVSMLGSGIVVIEAIRIDLISKKLVENIEIGKTTSVEILMERAPAACCKLNGEWSLVLNVEKDVRPAKDRSKTTAKKVVGSVSFSDKYPSPFKQYSHEVASNVHQQFGKYDIDLTKIFGKDFTKSISTTYYGVSRESEIDPLKQASGVIYDANIVDIEFIPGMSHGGLSLSGKIVNNNFITGSWYKRGYTSEVSGSFRMRRINE